MLILILIHMFEFKKFQQYVFIRRHNVWTIKNNEFNNSL